MHTHTHTLTHAYSSHSVSSESALEVEISVKKQHSRVQTAQVTNKQLNFTLTSFAYRSESFCLCKLM